MKKRLSILSFSLILLGLIASIVLITTIAHTIPVSATSSEASILSEEISGYRYDSLLPLRFPAGDWPWYAQGEISLDPEPPVPGMPAEICVGIVNDDYDSPHIATLHIGVAPLGIGVSYVPVGTVEVIVPAGGYATGCSMWVSPGSGKWGIEVLLYQEGAQEPLRSLRNINLWEILIPGDTQDFIFPIGPMEREGTLILNLSSYLPDWQLSLNPRVIIINPYQVYTATLSISPPPGILLGSNLPIADVEGFLNDQPIGGLRMLDSAVIPIHNTSDPIYAEREITINPYPVIVSEPTDVCVALRNPTPSPQNVNVNFSWAGFGIGLPFTPIHGPISVVLPPYSVVNQCITWVPPISGHLCLQVELLAAGYEPQFSQRNIDVNELLQPGVPDTLTFPVGNPLQQPTTINLSLIPHLTGWDFELSQYVLPNIQPGEVRLVTLTVTPPTGQPLPPDNTPVVDVEAISDGKLIGGFRKVFRPPVPLHSSPDPTYAEREITINPYPVFVSAPTEVCVKLRNPTPFPQAVVVNFSWAGFGIGLPFTPINGPVPVLLPPYSVVNQCITWVPPISGHLCLQVELLAAGYEPQFSQRNIDVSNSFQPGVPYLLDLAVGNPFQQPITVTLGLIQYLPGWSFEFSQAVLPDIPPGEVRQVTLTVTPPTGQPLPPDNTPVVDVEAFTEGKQLGGIELQYLHDYIRYTFLPIILK